MGQHGNKVFSEALTELTSGAALLFLCWGTTDIVEYESKFEQTLINFSQVKLFHLAVFWLLHILGYN